MFTECFGYEFNYYYLCFMKKEETIVISFRKPKSFVKRLKEFAGSEQLDLTDFFELLVERYANGNMETGPYRVKGYQASDPIEVGHVKESDGAPPQFVGNVIYKHMPGMEEKGKHVEALAPEFVDTVNYTKKDIMIEFRRKRRGLNYNEKMEPYFKYLFQ